MSATQSGAILEAVAILESCFSEETVEAIPTDELSKFDQAVAILKLAPLA